MKIFWVLRTYFLKIFYGRIGKKCYIAPALYVKKRKKIFLGNDVRIFPNMRAEVHRDGYIRFEGDNSIGQNLHIISGGELIIGYGTTISSNVFISNVDHTFIQGESAVKTDLIIKETKIGKNCFIGTGAVILPGTILGDNVIVGANTTVKGTFGNNCILAGGGLAHIVGEVKEK